MVNKGESLPGGLVTELPLTGAAVRLGQALIGGREIRIEFRGAQEERNSGQIRVPLSLFATQPDGLERFQRCRCHLRVGVIQRLD